MHACMHGALDLNNYSGTSVYRLQVRYTEVLLKYMINNHDDDNDDDNDDVMLQYTSFVRFLKV